MFSFFPLYSEFQFQYFKYIINIEKYNNIVFERVVSLVNAYFDDVTEKYGALGSEILSTFLQNLREILTIIQVLAEFRKE